MYSSLYKATPEELKKNTKIPLLVMNSFGEVHYEYAVQMLTEIMTNNAEGKRTVFICPCGPTDQYSILARLVNERNVSLKNTWIINMDEYPPIALFPSTDIWTSCFTTESSPSSLCLRSREFSPTPSIPKK